MPIIVGRIEIRFVRFTGLINFIGLVLEAFKNTKLIWNRNFCPNKTNGAPCSKLQGISAKANKTNATNLIVS